MKTNETPEEPVILEDLDALELKRDKIRTQASLKTLLFPGKDGDLLLWRRLFSFARPYVAKIVFCLFLSSVAGIATVGKLWFVKSGLEPMTDPAAIAKELREGDEKGSPSFLDSFDLIEYLNFDFFGEEEKEEKEEPPAKEVPSQSETIDAETPLTPAEVNFVKNRLLVVILIFVLVVFGEQIGMYFQAVMIRSVGHRIVMDIRNALFARVMSFSLKFHNKNHSGKLISRLTNDLGVFGSFFTQTAVGMTKDVFIMAGCLGFLFLEGGLYIISMLAILAMVFLPIQTIGRRIRRRDKLTQRSMSSIYSALSESFMGQKIIKAFGTEDYEYERFRQVAAKTYRNTMKSARLRSRTQPVVELSGAIVIGGIMLFLGFKVISSDITFGNMASVVTALVMAIGPLRRLARANNNVQSAFASADRVATLLYSEPEIQDRDHARELKSFGKTLAYEKVSFEHDQGIPVLNQIDFTIKKGQILALVGPSGSGKTTLVDLLPRFYDVIQGAIKIDGNDLRDLTLRSLRSQIGIVSQESILFNDSIRMNIAYGIPETSMDAIRKAAEAANAHEFIMETEEGYDTLIGERGVRLSGGQKQRIAIARAILKNPPILILDEATSALDSEAEHQVQEALSRLMAGRTTLVIAHRLSTIRSADMILVMKEGEIVERGQHEELLAREGVYARLHDLQTHGPEKKSD